MARAAMAHDVVVVGAGHNGLVCAAYLARAGHDVLVLERRGVIGGAVCTEEVFPGHAVDTGSSVHVAIHLTPIVRELALARYGLVYQALDPFAWAPLAEGGAIAFYKDVDRTCASLARVSPRDADAYRAFVAEWRGVVRGVARAFQEPPTPARLLSAIARGAARGPRTDPGRLLRAMAGSAESLLCATFANDAVRGALGWLAAQGGVPVDAPFTGVNAAWTAAYHETGAARPRGGSGELARALGECVRAHGGRVRTGAKVARVVVERGRARGVELAGGERIEARAVVCACHVVTALTELMREACPRRVLARARRLRVGNGFGVVVRASTTELPRYAAAPDDPEATIGMQLLCPSLAYLRRARADHEAGRVSAEPAVLAMTFTRVDPAIAPSGRHLLYAWAQYAPYALADGARWDELRDQIGERVLEAVARHAPNMRGAVRERFVQAPPDLEARFGMLRGNVMHLDMDLGQMFALRPLAGLSGYVGPVPGTFLTGAGTHPGGGVFGASGRSAARVVGEALA